MDVAQHTFLVTGGASGLGAAASQHLIARGAHVVIADINAAGSEFAAHVGGGCLFVRTDVTEESDGIAAVEAAERTFGALHGLVNCAGIAPSERIAGKAGPHDLENFKRAVAINLVGTFNMLRLAAASMAKNEPNAEGERGIIINTASISAYEGQIGQSAYAASKAGVIGLTLPAARELARSGIRVMTIAPGVFETPMVSRFPSSVQDTLAQAVPFPARLGRPAEFAQLVETICELPMLNGETIRLDGALRMGPK